MRAVVCKEYGTPEVLVVDDLPEPLPGPGEVVVAVGAAAVNFPDVLFIANKYQVSIPPPFVPGSEFAGTITSVGRGVTDLAPGDRVFGAVMVGAFAERVCVPAAGLTRIPDGVALSDAAAFWVAYATSYHSLRSVAEVREGETVLILGAAGGVGLAAVQLACVLGARVIAAASSAEKLEVAARQGAEGLINYASENLRERLRALAPGGVNVVIDPVGGPDAALALRGMAPAGRYVVVGFASGQIPDFAANVILLKNARVCGFEMRTFGEIDPEGQRRNEAELIELLTQGRVQPHIGKSFPLLEAATALRYVADRHATGKVLLTT
jgi:NADPH2:quinone reductase